MAGTVHLKPGRLVYYGTFSEVPFHSSIAVGIVAVIAGRIELYDGTGPRATLCATGTAAPDVAAGNTAAAVLPPGPPHGLRACPADPPQPTEVLVAILEPDSPAGRTLTGRLERAGGHDAGPDAWIAAARACAPLVRRPDPDHDPAGSELLDELLRALADGEPAAPRTIHPALRRALDLIPGRLGHGVRLSGLAADVGLSPSRLGHLFTVELGLPYRAYVRWARLQKVVDALRAGATLTGAAHAAGFTDSAHMNRVCWQMFGLNPSEFVRDLRWA